LAQSASLGGLFVLARLLRKILIQRWRHVALATLDPECFDNATVMTSKPPKHIEVNIFAKR
jgi:hypothetical protein